MSNTSGALNQNEIRQTFIDWCYKQANEDLSLMLADAAKKDRDLATAITVILELSSDAPLNRDAAIALLVKHRVASGIRVINGGKA